MSSNFIINFLIHCHKHSTPWYFFAASVSEGVEITTASEHKAVGKGALSCFFLLLSLPLLKRVG